MEWTQRQTSDGGQLAFALTQWVSVGWPRMTLNECRHNQSELAFAWRESERHSGVVVHSKGMRKIAFYHLSEKKGGISGE